MRPRLILTWDYSETTQGYNWQYLLFQFSLYLSILASGRDCRQRDRVLGRPAGMAAFASDGRMPP